jgi:hypothetical protein
MRDWGDVLDLQTVLASLKWFLFSAVWKDTDTAPSIAKAVSAS